MHFPQNSNSNGVSQSVSHGAARHLVSPLRPWSSCQSTRAHHYPPGQTHFPPKATKDIAASPDQHCCRWIEMEFVLWRKLLSLTLCEHTQLELLLALAESVYFTSVCDDDDDALAAVSDGIRCKHSLVIVPRTFSRVDVSVHRITDVRPWGNLSKI